MFFAPLCKKTDVSTLEAEVGIVRYYGWYSNKMRGQRLKRVDGEAAAPPEGEVIELSEPKARRIPSKKWRELIKKVWEADPLLCPHCENEMRVVALIDQAEPDEPVFEPWLDDPFPDYDHEPVFAHK